MAYLSTDPSFQGHRFKNCVCQIDSFPAGYFDVVLIDGRARPSCLMHGARKVKPGRLLILDNADRSYYTDKTSAYLQNFTRNESYGIGPYVGYVWRTDIYVRGK